MLRQVIEPPVKATRLPVPGEQEIQWLMFDVTVKFDPMSFQRVKSRALKSVVFWGGVVDTGTVANALLGIAGHGVIEFDPEVKDAKLVNVYAQTSVHPPPSVSMSQYARKALSELPPSGSNQ